MVFRPGWKLTLFVLLLFPGLLALGTWQLQRAEEKSLILQQVADRRAQAPMSLSDLLQRDNPAYTQIALRGSYLDSRVILLDNQVFKGRFGYEVIEPFRSESGELVLVSRGWVPGSLQRDQLPELEAASGPQQLVGEVYVPLGKAFTLVDEALPPGWPKRIQALDVALLAPALGEQTYPYVVRLRAGSPSALTAHWQDVNVQPEKHTAYAVQWFVMALVLFLLYLAVGLGLLVSKKVVIQ